MNEDLKLLSYTSQPLPPLVGFKGNKVSSKVIWLLIIARDIFKEWASSGILARFAFWFLAQTPSPVFTIVSFVFFNHQVHISFFLWWDLKLPLSSYLVQELLCWIPKPMMTGEFCWQEISSSKIFMASKIVIIIKCIIIKIRYNIGLNFIKGPCEGTVNTRGYEWMFINLGNVGRCGLVWMFYFFYYVYFIL